MAVRAVRVGTSKSGKPLYGAPSSSPTTAITRPTSTGGTQTVSSSGLVTERDAQGRVVSQYQANKEQAASYTQQQGEAIKQEVAAKQQSPASTTGLNTFQKNVVAGFQKNVNEGKLTVEQANTMMQPLLMYENVRQIIPKKPTFGEMTSKGWVGNENVGVANIQARKGLFDTTPLENMQTFKQAAGTISGLARVTGSKTTSKAFSGIEGGISSIETGLTDLRKSPLSLGVSGFTDTTTRQTLMIGATLGTLYVGGYAFGAVREGIAGIAAGGGAVAKTAATGLSMATYGAQGFGTYQAIKKTSELTSGVDKAKISKLNEMQGIANIEQDATRGYFKGAVFGLFPSLEKDKTAFKESIYKQSRAAGLSDVEARENVADALKLQSGQDVAYTAALLQPEAFANVLGSKAEIAAGIVRGSKLKIAKFAATRVVPGIVEGASTITTAIYGRYGKNLEWQPKIPFTEIAISPKIKFDYNVIPTYKEGTFRPGIVLTAATGGAIGAVSASSFAAVEGLAIKSTSKLFKGGAEIGGQLLDFPAETSGDVLTPLIEPFSSGRAVRGIPTSAFTTGFAGAKSNVKLNVDITKLQGDITLTSITQVERGGVKRTNVRIAEFSNAFTDNTFKTSNINRGKAKNYNVVKVPSVIDTKSRFTEIIVPEISPSVSSFSIPTKVTTKSLVSTPSISGVPSVVKTSTNNYLTTNQYTNVNTDINTNINMDVPSTVLTPNLFYLPKLPEGGGGNAYFKMGKKGRRATKYLPSLASSQKEFRKLGLTATRKTSSLSGIEVRL